MKNLLIYFSGTGNTLYITQNLCNELKNSTMLSITEFQETYNEIEDNTKIGFIFPTYFFSIPRFYSNLLKNISLNPKCFYYGITTCNGFYGNTASQLKELLEAKNCKLSFFTPIKMPGNYLLEYNPPDNKRISQRFNEADITLTSIIEKVENDYSENIRRNLSLISNLFSKTMYKNQSNWGKKFYTTDKCISCKLCKNVCKFSNIEFKNNKPCWGNNCEHCMACINICPKNAIEYGKKTQKRRRYKNPKIELLNLTKD